MTSAAASELTSEQCHSNATSRNRQTHSETVLQQCWQRPDLASPKLELKAVCLCLCCKLLVSTDQTCEHIAAGLRSEPRSGCQRLQWTTCLLCSSLCNECKETGWTNTATGTQREHGPALTLYLGTLHVDVPCLLEDIFLSHDLQSIIH